MNVPIHHFLACFVRSARHLKQPEWGLNLRYPSESRHSKSMHSCQMQRRWRVLKLRNPRLQNVTIDQNFEHVILRTPLVSNYWETTKDPRLGSFWSDSSQCRGLANLTCRLRPSISIQPQLVQWGSKISIVAFYIWDCYNHPGVT